MFVIFAIIIIASFSAIKPVLARTKPNLPDLDVLFIERLPRYNFDSSKKWPAYGEEVEFRGHIKNNGTQPVENFGFIWRIDDQIVSSGTILSLNQNEETIVTYRWSWAHTVSEDGRIQGNHTVELVVDPNNYTTEISESNNQVKDFTQALSVGFWVEQAVYDFFHENQFYHCQGKTCRGSNSWEDWAQRQIKEWNKIFEKSKYPSYPDGVIDRVRLDKIVIVPNCALPISGGIADNHPDIRDKTVDLMWGFTSAKVGVIACDRDRNDGNKYLYQNNPHFQNIEYPLMHELSHARYLIDTYCLSVQASEVQVNDENGNPISGTPFLPYVSGKNVWLNKDQKMMGGGVYEEGYGEHSVGALNRVWGLRARGGNYNSPSVIGEYLNDVPKNNRFLFLSTEGKSLEEASVSIYKGSPASGYCGKVYDNMPDITITADFNGLISVDGNLLFSPPVHHFNSIPLFKIKYRNQTEYLFQEISDFNLAYWRGEKNESNLIIRTRIIACPRYQEGNLNCDESELINREDLNLLLSEWDVIGPILEAPLGQISFDLNSDGKIDEKDLSLLIAHRRDII